MKKKMLWACILNTFLVLMTACGGGNDSTSNSPNDHTSEVTVENGLITLEEYDTYANERRGIVRFRMQGNNINKIDILYASREAHMTSDGTMVYAHYCKGAYTEIMMYHTNNSLNPITPCSNKISGYQSTLTYFRRPQLSPSKQYIAVGVLENAYDNYTTTIYDISGNEIARFDNFKGAVWFSDNRLLLQSTKNKGLYLIDANDFSNPTLIQQLFPADATDLHVSSSGKQVMYISASRAWLMDIETGKTKLLPLAHSDIIYTSWSPSEKQIAYIRLDSLRDSFPYIYFYDIKSKKTLKLHSNKVLTPDSSGTFLWKAPIGPINWN